MMMLIAGWPIEDESGNRSTGGIQPPVTSTWNPVVSLTNNYWAVFEKQVKHLEIGRIETQICQLSTLCLSIS